ncbi:MAG: hypothetical protein P4K83_00630 [Terracidiphilus sp.]|nr:hypothetical protein [Terracidiphilus sp.]
MTQEEINATGKAMHEHRNAITEFEAIKKRHNELVSELKKFVYALEQKPLTTYVSINSAPPGLLQKAIETPAADYFYTTSLESKLRLQEMKNHLDSYRAISERIDLLQRRLKEQGFHVGAPSD